MSYLACYNHHVFSAPPASGRVVVSESRLDRLAGLAAAGGYTGTPVENGLRPSAAAVWAAAVARGARVLHGANACPASHGAGSAWPKLAKLCRSGHRLRCSTSDSSPADGVSP